HGLTTEPLHQLPSPSPLLLFTGLQAQTPGELSQREGSNLFVLCPYLAEHEYRELKSWCRWTVEGCQPEVEINGTRTYTYTERARQGHITIQGDPIHRNFSVTMTDLQVEDSGTYFCAYRKAWERFILLKRISLNVFKGEYLFPMETLVLSGGNVIAALTDTNYTRGISKAQKGRALIWDDSRKRTITITMEKLQAQDSGVYWCALYRLYPTIRLTRIMEVRLSVAKREYLLADFEPDLLSMSALCVHKLLSASAQACSTPPCYLQISARELFCLHFQHFCHVLGWVHGAGLLGSSLPLPPTFPSFCSFACFWWNQKTQVAVWAPRLCWLSQHAQSYTHGSNGRDVQMGGAQQPSNCSYL
uniref:Ig-like domain-containing protein n=1 Tax=Anas platyrhynchos platyrhynchos TaxID=8840 RepID=A0A493TGM3_ANAPP